MAQEFSSRTAVAPDVLFRSVGGEAVLLNMKSEMYLGLDEVGTQFWTVLQESQSIEEAYEKLLAEYEVDGGRLRRDLSDFVDTLLENGLIEISPASSESSASQ